MLHAFYEPHNYTMNAYSHKKQANHSLLAAVFRWKFKFEFSLPQLTKKIGKIGETDYSMTKIEDINDEIIIKLSDCVWIIHHCPLFFKFCSRTFEICGIPNNVHLMKHVLTF